MTTQRDRARQFQALHQRPGIFVMPNPWGAGSAKLFASLGFEAMATANQGLANALGRADGALITTPQLEAAGVKRLSVGGALSRLGLTAVRDAALAKRVLTALRHPDPARAGGECRHGYFQPSA